MWRFFAIYISPHFYPSATATTQAGRFASRSHGSLICYKSVQPQGPRNSRQTTLPKRLCSQSCDFVKTANIGQERSWTRLTIRASHSMWIASCKINSRWNPGSKMGKLSHVTKLNQPHLERFPLWLWRNFHSRVAFVGLCWRAAMGLGDVSNALTGCRRHLPA